MTTITDIRANGSQVVNAATPIIEPIDAQSILAANLDRFGDHYNVSPNSHLFRFLASLCGEASAGSLKKESMLSRLAGQLSNTYFFNLDRLYGDALFLPRRLEESYLVNPEQDNLTQSDWDDVFAKDAAYRERCLAWMRAIFAGPTRDGIKLAGEAALGVECDVFEQYKYLDGTGVPNYGKFNSRNEFIIIPRTPTVSDPNLRLLSRLIDRLKPMNTVETVYFGNDIRTARIINNVSASSDRFNVLRNVVGRTDISWPDVNSLTGTWIVSGVSQEAPTYAFMNRQESVTFIDVDNLTATSAHMGNFNKQQAALFSNLAKDYDPNTFFSPNSAYAKNIAPLNINQGWVNTSQFDAHDTLVANLYYPLRYFSIDGIIPSVDSTTGQFWSSVENIAGTSEDLIIDFGRVRPCNFVSFETTPKPLDFEISYDDGSGNWIPVTDAGNNTYSLSMTYQPAMENPWVLFDYRFNLVQTQRIKLTFTRLDIVFPLPSSDPFPFSIDIRSLRLMHVMNTKEDFVADIGTDILGNSSSTSLYEYLPLNVEDSTTSFWSSKPNPSRTAVESLYFDLRVESHQGTQDYLNTQVMADLDDRGQSDIEFYLSGGQVVDEVYIDPIYPGADMHFYYSNDDNPVYDEKLWSPIPRNYICRKGYHPLPAPVNVHYLKIEFSNLSSIPYQPVEYPTLPKVLYNTYPSWVTSAIDTSTPRDIPTSLSDVETVSFEPLDLFQNVDTRMGQTFEQMRSELEQDTEPEIKKQIEELLALQVDDTAQTTIEDNIHYRSTIMWQQDLLQQIDPESALGRVATAPQGDFTDTGFNAELGLPAYVPPIQSSVTDLSQAALDKSHTIYWFPQTCRHGYKVVEASLDSKLAFIVAIRQVALLRRNYGAENDEPIYIETMDDTAHILTNDFSFNIDNSFYVGV